MEINYMIIIILLSGYLIKLRMWYIDVNNIDINKFRIINKRIRILGAILPLANGLFLVLLELIFLLIYF